MKVITVLISYLLKFSIWNFEMIIIWKLFFENAWEIIQMRGVFPMRGTGMRLHWKAWVIVLRAMRGTWQLCCLVRILLTAIQESDHPISLEISRCDSSFSPLSQYFSMIAQKLDSHDVHGEILNGTSTRTLCRIFFHYPSDALLTELWKLTWQQVT